MNRNDAFVVIAILAVLLIILFIFGAFGYKVVGRRIATYDIGGGIGGDDEPTGPYCGDGVVEAGEECESDADCPNALWQCGEPGHQLECMCYRSVLDCIDLDGPLNYFVKGSTTGMLPGSGIFDDPVYDTKEDSCTYMTNGMVIEPMPPIEECEGQNCAVHDYYCEVNDEGEYFIAKETVLCPNGCSDGACNVASHGSVLDMLNSDCFMTFDGLYELNYPYTPNDVCEAYNSRYGKDSTCIFAHQTLGHVTSCNLEISGPESGQHHVMCCSTP